MALIGLKEISLAFGRQPVLDGVDLQIQDGERICLVGRNGAGKSSLLRLISGEAAPDSGTISRQKGSNSAFLAQEVPDDIEGSILHVIAGGLGKEGKLLEKHHQLSLQLGIEWKESLALELERLQHEMETAGAWQAMLKVETIISRMSLKDDDDFSTLSTGMKRRVLLARAAVSSPDLLLLDEPTNHLDIESILWMEEFLLDYRGTLVFVTHDRAFLRRLATRIVELDRGKLFDWACDYDAFLVRRDAALQAEEAEWERFDKKLAREEVWVRQGIKARRTRNEGRVRALKEMRRERSERRQRTETARMSIQEAERSGRIVIEAQGISHRYGEKEVVSDFSCTVARGDKIGIIGPNGAGKTTLLNILLGKLTPSEGTVRHGARLEVAYFDQLRGQLDETKTVRDNVCAGDTVVVNGKSRHIIGYLEDFLFTPDRARTPITMLSGGERNRLLLAKLFTKPSNVLVLDEPTNDLDEETLTLLEELLIDYPGTILLVCHDRVFLNNVVTSVAVFEGNGKVREVVGGYDDWLRLKEQLAPKSNGKDIGRKDRKSKSKSDGPRKISQKERMELEKLPARIEELERDRDALYENMADAAFYKSGGEQVSKATGRLEDLNQELAELFKRWEELEALSSGQNEFKEW
ncbi:MAG: ATP-binding cassette domain-containing protein [Nitrospinae bacterium]|nr:ATP-binding cassette domain-containing protein [Nitrospinota bacterium]